MWREASPTCIWRASATGSLTVRTPVNWTGTPVISCWRSVFQRRAPVALSAVEACIAPKGNTTQDITEDLLVALTQAYQEAAS